MFANKGKNSILTTRNSIVALALIGVLIIAGNVVRNRSGDDSAERGTGIALAAATAQTPVGVAFQFGAMIDDARSDAAEREADRQRDATDRQQEAAESELEADAAVAVEPKKEAFDDLPGSVTRATLEAIADCESGGDPEIVSSNGLYHGKYQFHPDTWESVGGKGLPSEAPEAEQDYRAALLYERSGPGQWPVCGQ